MTGVDRFGNRIDPEVGFARGRVLASSRDEIRRLRRAQRVAAETVAASGPESIAVFTGNTRCFPIEPDDVAIWCEEWVGPGVFADRLQDVVVGHLGGDGTEAVAVINRTSAAIVAAVLSLAGGRPVVSVVPKGDRSHASVVRGCGLAGVRLVEVDDAAAVGEPRPALVMITPVTSTLARMADRDLSAAIAAARSAGATVFLDDAYGARLRPVLHGGARSMELGPDLVVTNADKAGLSGPRAGVMAGRPECVVPVLARASELGMEARAPVAAGALRSLERFDPAMLQQQAADGRAVADALAERLGDDVVHRSDLGPSVSEEDVLGLLVYRSSRPTTALVPCEATAAVGMLLLRDGGVLTVNTHGQPGGRVCIRLKPTTGAVNRVGGAERLAAALDEALDIVAGHLDDPDWVARLLFGDD